MKYKSYYGGCFSVSERNRSHTIDVIKGIAIILVLITHYEWTQDQRKFFAFPFIINMAIPVFMVITGYVYSLSLEKHAVDHLEDAYSWETILKRTIRYTLPFMAVIMWELFDPHFTISAGVLEKLRWAIDGTAGKGSYYYPVMMQLVFVFPLIYFVIEKQRERGLVLCLIANAVYEVLIWAYGVPAVSYRLLMFRYVFLVAAGVFAFKRYRFPLWVSILMTATGAAFIAVVIYTGYEPRIFNKDWITTNFLSSMLIVPFMVWGLQNLKLRVLPLEITGRASYHIFLVQMVYYAGYYSVLQQRIPMWQGHLIAGMAISLVLGVIFYYVDKPVQDGIGRLIHRGITSRS